MKIIDWDCKGNMVRFYLGEDDCTDYHGDDWNDAPYDCNAGTVYKEYIKGHRDIVFPYDALVLEPCDGVVNCRFCKDDMVAGIVPCIIVVPAHLAEGTYDDSYLYWARCKGVKAYYFNDSMEPSDEVIVQNADWAWPVVEEAKC